MNTRHPLHCRVNTVTPKQQEVIQRSRVAQEPDKNLLPVLTTTEQLLLAFNNTSYEKRISFPEETLDEYCHEFLDNMELDKRDASQVLCRHYDQSQEAGTKKSRDEIKSQDFLCREQCQHDTPFRDGAAEKEILVVSQLWIWRIGGWFCSLSHYIFHSRYDPGV